MSVSDAIGIAEKYLQENIISERFDEALSILVEMAKAGSPDIKGWVARDEDHTLWFHFAMPYRDHVEDAHYENKIWYSDGRFLQFDSKEKCSVFKNLKWNDDPIKVGLYIKPLLDEL